MDRGHQAEDPRKTDDRMNVDHPLYWTHIRRILLASGASFNDTEDEAGALTSNQERGGHTHAHVPCPALKRVIRHFYGIGIGIGPYNQSGGGAWRNHPDLRHYSPTIYEKREVEGSTSAGVASCEMQQSRS